MGRGKPPSVSSFLLGSLKQRCQQYDHNTVTWRSTYAGRDPASHKPYVPGHFVTHMRSEERVGRSAKVLRLVFLWSVSGTSVFMHIDPEIYLDKSLGFISIVILQTVVDCWSPYIILKAFFFTFRPLRIKGNLKLAPKSQGI